MSTQKERQLDYYENEVSDYEKSGVLQRTTNRAFKRKAKIISKSIEATPKNNVLEVGAGSGLLTYFTTDVINYKNYAGPAILAPIFDIIDTISPHIPIWKKLTALWIVAGEK